MGITEREMGMTEKIRSRRVIGKSNPYSKMRDKPLFHRYVIDIMIRL